MAVGAVVLIAGLVLVAGAGTDVPFYDQWGIEGQWLYPRWLAGDWRWLDLTRAFNEHRIAWTQALDLGLFAIDGQWDPLVQLVVNAALRALVAGGVAWLVWRRTAAAMRPGAMAAIALAFLPVLAWHNVLWGIESHAAFVLGFSIMALALLGDGERSTRRMLTGLVAAGAALLAMGPGALVPVALLGMILLRAIEARRRPGWKELGPALVLLGVAAAMRVEATQHAALRPEDAGAWLSALGRLLAWPGEGWPVAVAMNLPMVAIVTGRLARRRTARRGEDFVLLAGFWSGAVAFATAWVRGGSAELATGVPSRYVDFLVLLPLANAWSAATLANEMTERWRRSARIVAAAWGVFVFAGWLGLSAQMWRGVLAPRMRDREAPVRLLREFQRTGDAAVFAGQPRLLVPAPDLGLVRAVLEDPRMRGKLPPSLQPERPMGPLSRGVRLLLERQ